jgi:hypothetical protein
MNDALRGRSGDPVHSRAIKRGLDKPPIRRIAMLNKLLATSALVVIGAVFIQSANAADEGKLRQLVVEPAGAHAPDAAGLPTGDAGKTVNFVLKTGQGIPTPTQTADAGAAAAAANSAALDGKPPVNQLIVTPPGGIATPVPSGIANPPGTPSADAGAPLAGAAGAGALPGAAGAAAPAAADPAPPPAIQGIPAASGAPANAGQPAAGAAATPAAPAIAAAPAAPAASPAPAVAAVSSPDDLYKLLTGRGYGVEISKHDAYGDVIFYVTIPGYPQDAYLLTVGQYGKVKETKHIAAYGYGHSYSYDHSAKYAPAYGSDDNCDYGTGYNAGY